MMVSTDPEHHFANSGTTLTQYWKEAGTLHTESSRFRHENVRHRQHHLGSPITGATGLRMLWNLQSAFCP